MVNTLVHDVHVADYLVVEDGDQLERAMRYFGPDLPLDKTLVVELLAETLSDGSKAYSLRIREAEPV